VLLRTAPDEVADKTWRAYGLLKYARKLTFEETMNLLSGVRLGVGLNLIPSLSVYTLNKLLIFTQPAHLAALEDARPVTLSCPRCARRMCVACWRLRRREEEVGGR